MESPVQHNQVTNTPELPLIYRSAAITEPLGLRDKGLAQAYAIIKPWPLSLMSSPRRRLPQTSSLVWADRHRTQRDLPLNESRQSQLSEFSPYEASLVSAHLKDIAQHSDATPYSLPDKSVVPVSKHLEPLLKEILSCRMIHLVVRFLYYESGDGGFDGVFRYVFCLDRKKPLEKLDQCPLGTTTVVLSSHPTLTITNHSKAAFDPQHLAIVNIDQLEHTEGLLPLATLLQKSESLLRRPKQPNSTRKTQWPKPLMVPASVLSTVELPPFADDMFHRSVREGMKIKVPPIVEVSRKQISVKPQGRTVGRSLSKPETSNEMLVTSKPQSSSYVPAGSLKPISIAKLIEGNAGFRMKPEIGKLHSTRKNSGVTHTKTGDAGETAISTLHHDNRMKKSLVQITDQVLKQVDVESFCARYSLTHSEFAQLLEEFALLALEGYEHVPTGRVPEGVQVSVLCSHYRVDIEALRAVNPRLFDLPATDPLDIRRVIPPSGLIYWPDFVTFYLLAVLQRAQFPDLIAFLMRYLHITQRAQLEFDRLFEALKSKFAGTRAFTETIRGIWTRICESVSEECSHEAPLQPADLAAALSHSKASLLDLRFLVAELFHLRQTY